MKKNTKKKFTGASLMISWQLFTRQTNTHETFDLLKGKSIKDFISHFLNLIILSEVEADFKNID